MWMPDLPPTLVRLLTPQLDATSAFPAVALLALVAYLAGVRSLHRRRMPWPWHRTASFVVGIATVIYVAVALGVFGTLSVDEVIDSGGRTGFADLTLASVASAAGVSTPKR